jgi:hypothetical protein
MKYTKRREFLKNGQRYFSKLYKRMIKRICHVVLLNDRTVGAVQYFLFDKRTMMVYATITQFHVGNASFLDKITGGKHLTSVKLMDSGSKAIVPVDTLAESLFFIDPLPTNTYSCVSRVPHCHGRSVFKWYAQNDHDNYVKYFLIELFSSTLCI